MTPETRLLPASISHLLCLVLAIACSQTALAQERWFQVEVSVFSNESPADRNEELWLAERSTLDFPRRLRRLDRLFDRLLIDALRPAPAGPEAPLSQPATEEPTAQQRRQAAIAQTGPFPPRDGEAYRFIDFQRSAFVQLPASVSAFQQTNAALQRNPGHRLLFHGLWRQPMADAGAATPVYIEGGLAYGEHHELEGSLGIYFNNSRDRIVVDADLWLSEFSINPDPEQDWRLPPKPAGLATTEPGREAIPTDNFEYFPIIVYHLEQRREMRSGEFHYLDHPALGLVITVEPYEVPPLPEPESDEGPD